MKNVFRHWCFFIFSILSFGLPLNLFAQAGAIDNTFNTNDIIHINNRGAGPSIYSHAIQSDGKIIIVGGSTYNGVSRRGIARINVDGSLDDSFNPGVGVFGTTYSVAVQADGRILIGGSFTAYNGVLRSGIARINADGSLDTSFDPGLGTNNFINTFAIQNDGKILIGGNFTTYNGFGRKGIARINADGSLDTSFDPGNGASVVLSISLDVDEKIIIGGQFTTYNGVVRNRIARVNTDGSLDTDFNPGIGANNSVNSVRVQSDGKILIGGDFTTYNGVGRKLIARVNTDGSLDTDFNPGTGANNSVNSVRLQSDGKILIGGNFTTYNSVGRNRIARVNTNGSLDTDFNPGSGITGFQVYSVELQSDEKITIAGVFNLYNGFLRRGIARIETDGSLDISFNTNSGPSGHVWTISNQNDGKIIIGGLFHDYNDIFCGNICRIHTDGSVDNSFNTGSGTNSIISSSAIQDDGKILLCGSFTNYNGIARNKIARLNSNGNLDASFDPGSSANNSIYSIGIQNDGKIIIGGQFTTYNGVPRNGIARIQGDGNLDTSFDPGSGVNSGISSIVIQNDGKIIIGGQFTTYNGIPRNGIARIHSDGNLDISFDPGSGVNSTISSIVIQNDGKIIIGGQFTSYNGILRNGIARIQGDGNLDTSFDPGTGTNGYVSSAKIQSDGKIIIGGLFSRYNNIINNGIARLNADGSLDNSFIRSSRIIESVPVLQISIQSDGKILIGGQFRQYNDTVRTYIARLLGDEQSNQTWYIDADGDNYGGSLVIQSERPPNGFLLSELSGNGTDDCDDTNPAIHPGADEICDGLDNDCDGEIDEGLGTITCGIGACQVTIPACINGVPQICVPGDPSEEICDGLDNDCDGVVDETDLAVDAGNCTVVYYGYSSTECTDLTATTTGGAAPYSYSWSTGESTATISVCPSATTSYSVTVTDDHDCAVTDIVRVEVVDVRCGSNNNKVLVCHTEPGNPNNICIASSAVPAHLAHGDYLGTCGAADPCEETFSLKGTTNNIHSTFVETENITEHFFNDLRVKGKIVYPNPTDQYVTIDVGNRVDKYDLHFFTNAGIKVKSISQLQGIQKISTADLSNGVYYVNIRTSAETITKYLVVIH